jgi:tRNA C32,U32 (ribose-2'-O)-methylase TrmJ
MISEIDPAVTDILGLLQHVGYLRGTPAEKVALTARQSLQQAQISRRHVLALRGMVSRIRWALASPGVDWEKTSKQ